MDQKSLRRFWAKADRRGGSKACWPWLGATEHGDYGKVVVGGRAQAAHRVAYEITRGVRLTGEDWIGRSCKNSLCVNPEHLVRRERHWQLKQKRA